MSADKRDQIDKERLIREAGGVFVKDRSTGELVSVLGISTVERRIYVFGLYSLGY